MMSRWTLTDVEFSALWAAAKAGALPAPLSATSRVRNADEFDRQYLAAAQRLESMPDFESVRITDILVRPDITVSLDGWDNRKPADHSAYIQVYAARRGPHGMVVVQIPGETASHSKGFTLIPCAAVELASMIARHLPTSDPGTWGELLLDDETDGLDHSYGRSPVRAADRTRPPNLAAQFLAVPTGSMGGIDIRQARSAFGPRGCVRYRLAWRDLVDDGRYLITDDIPPRAVPIDSQGLVAMINQQIAAVVQVLRDERGA